MSAVGGHEIFVTKIGASQFLLTPTFCKFGNPFRRNDSPLTVTMGVSSKVNFQPVNTDRDAHLPLEVNWARLIFRCVGLAIPPPQRACCLPSIAGSHSYTWVRGVIMVKCLTQGHNTLTITELELASTTGFILAPTAVAQTACKRQRRRCF